MFLVGKDYVFAQEKLSECLEEIHPLLQKNHDETGVYQLPYNPNYPRYLALEKVDYIRFFTARLNGQIVGFALFFMDFEIYQKEVQSATQTLNYVTPEHRGAGYSFMKFCDDILQKQGVNSIWRQASVKRDIGKVYERLGYALVEMSYLRRL
jgi:GNAT superfamily N-acetyltransferase